MVLAAHDDPPASALPPRPISAANWQVDLLGRVQASCGGTRVTRWPSRAVAGLLATLALAPTREHAREELAERLWPGVDAAIGRARLRKALTHLRGLLEPAGTHAPLLIATRHAVRLADGAVDSDVRQFEQLARQGQVEAAIALYAGELMPGFYDEWVLEERRRLEVLRERLVEPDHMPARSPAGVPHQATPALPAVRQVTPLPVYWTRAFGLEPRVREACQAVFQRRLATLVGHGGCGKSRLSVSVARALAQEQAAPFKAIAFVGMVECRSAAEVWNALVQALGSPGRGDARSQAIKALDAAPTLLVLDNLEQFDEGGVQVIGELLAAVPTLHVLGTSRRRLGLPGERVLELEGLPLPEIPDGPRDAPGQRRDTSTLALNPAVALFIDRARDSRADFRLTERNSAAVAGLVRLLAGMPLAIELAASRLRALNPGELLHRLQSDAGSPQLDLLARPAAGGAVRARHASLRHVVEWSWSQLAEDVADVLRAVAALPVPATVELASQAWLGLRGHAHREAPRPSEPELLGRVQLALAEAVDVSLVTPSVPADGMDAVTRYALLPPVREFALERTAADAAAAARARWRQALLDAARHCSSRGLAAMGQVEALIDHVHGAIVTAALDAAEDPQAPRDAACLAAALRRHWEVDTRSPPPPAVLQVLAMLLDSTEDDAVRCDLALLLSFASQHSGSLPRGRDQAQLALSLAGDDQRRAQAMMRIAVVDLWTGQTDSTTDRLLGDALRLTRQTGDLETECAILRSQFLLATNRDNDPVAGLVLAERTVMLWENLGHRRNASIALMDCASCRLDLGETERAFDELTRCEAMARDVAFPTGYIMASWQLGRAAMRLRRGDAALDAFRRCALDAWREQRPTYVADALVQLPGGLALCGLQEDAARLQGFAVPHWLQQVGPMYRSLERDVTVTRRLLRGMLGAERHQRLQAEGRSMRLDEAVALALGAAAVPTDDGRVRSP
jgi:predicted ATPase